MKQPEAPFGQGAIHLRQYLAFLRSRKWWIFVVTMLVVGATLGFSFMQTPLYEANAEVLVNPLDTSSSTQVATGPNLDTERKLATSEAVAEIAANDIDFEGGTNELLEKVSVSVATNTEILEVRFMDTDPEAAQQGSQAFAEAYLEYRRRQVLDDVVAASRAIQQRVEGRQEQLTKIERQIEEEEAAAEVAGETADTTDLQTQANTLQTQIAVLQQQLFDLAPPENFSVGQIVSPPDVPEAPASPNFVQNTILALAAGLALGIGVALLRERLDDRLRGHDDLETYARAPVLAVVPHTRMRRRKSKTEVISLAKPRSAATEAYKTLRTGVLYSASQRDAKVLLVTSAHAGEGKTTTTANLGIALAQAGKKVILVSADLRKPLLHRILDVRSSPGISTILSHEASLEEALVSSDAVRGLQVLPSGPVPANPAEMLGSEAMEKLLFELRESSDFVLIDTAPVLAVTDALTLASMADATLLVADASSTTRGAVAHAVQRLEQVNAQLLGAILNNFDPSKASLYQHYYYDSYSGYYGQETPRPSILKSNTGRAVGRHSQL